MKKRSTTPRIGSRLQLGYIFGGTALYRARETLDDRFPRFFNDFEGVLIIEGHPVLETQYSKFSLEPRAIVLARPGLHQTFLWDTNHPTHHAFFHFNLEEIPGDWPNISDWPYCCHRPARVLNKMFRHIVERTAQHTVWPTQQPTLSENRMLENFLDLYLTSTSTISNPLSDQISKPMRRPKTPSPHSLTYTAAEWAGEFTSFQK